MEILVVDDQGIVREGIALQLRLLDESFNITSVVPYGALADVRNHLKQSSPDIIFLDVRMNGNATAGMDFLDELKDGGCESRIIILSAEDDAETVGRAIANGAAGFITKNGADIAPLRRAIEIVVQGGTYISDELKRRRPTAISTAPPPPPSIKTVNAFDLDITAPRVYEVLWHITKGVRGYRAIARKMGIAESTVEGYAKEGFDTLHVRGKDGFFALLMQKGWKLAEPRSHSVSGHHSARGG